MSFAYNDFSFGTDFEATQVLAPALATQSTNRKHKREVCRYWLQSRCQKGLACEFLHKLDDSRMPSCPKGSSCDRIPGSSSSSSYVFEPCPFKHDAKKSRCVNYDAGFCSFGLRCPHEHVVSTEGPPLVSGLFFELPERPVNANYRKAVCSYWSSNQWCPYFDMCNFLHK